MLQTNYSKQKKTKAGWKVNWANWERFNVRPNTTHYRSYWGQVFTGQVT